MIEINNFYKASYNREKTDAPRKILGILVANKCKKIIDFGVWNGGSSVLSAKSLQYASGKEGNNLELYDFDFSEQGLLSAQERLQSGEKVSIRPIEKSTSYGEIYLYDLTWGDSNDKRSNMQSGNFINVVKNLFGEECFSGISYIFEKYNYFEWINNSKNKDFDFMHVDLEFRESEGGDVFRESMKSIYPRLKKDSIICFMHKNKFHLYRDSVDKMSFENKEDSVIYNEIREKISVFDETFPGIALFSQEGFEYIDFEVEKLMPGQYRYTLPGDKK